LKAKDVSALLELAGCSFLLGQWETDLGFRIPPEPTIFGRILKLSESFDWSTLADLTVADLNGIELKAGDQVFRFVFEKDQGWEWSGFLAPDSETFGQVSKPVGGSQGGQ
jgi:hypothetical protein